MKRTIIAAIAALMLLSSCSENYSNGERVGMVTQFSKKGWMWKSWEGSLNLTQTGMNSSGSEPFTFSIDNDDPDETTIKTIDSAANLGWKVKLEYHETIGKNWLNNRGATDHFVKKCVVLDRNPVGNIFGKGQDSTVHTTGKVIDTIYVVIVPKPQ